MTVKEVEEVFEAKTIITVKAYCPDCNVELIDADIVLLTNPAQFGYKCPICGKTIYSKQDYPYTKIKNEQ